MSDMQKDIKLILKSDEYKAAAKLCKLDNNNYTYCDDVKNDFLDSAISFIPSIFIMSICALIPFGNSILFLVGIISSVIFRSYIIAMYTADEKVFKHSIPEAIVGILLFVVYAFTSFSLFGSKKIICFIYLFVIFVVEVVFHLAEKIKIKKHNAKIKSAGREAKKQLEILEKYAASCKDEKYFWWSAPLKDCKNMTEYRSIYKKQKTQDTNHGIASIHSEFYYYTRIKLKQYNCVPTQDFVNQLNDYYSFDNKKLVFSENMNISQILINEEMDEKFRITHYSYTSPSQEEINEAERNINENKDFSERLFNANYHTNEENYYLAQYNDADDETKNYWKKSAMESDFLRKQKLDSYIEKNTHVETSTGETSCITTVEESKCVGYIVNGQFFLQKEFSSYKNNTNSRSVWLGVLGLCASASDDVIAQFISNPLKGYSCESDSYIASFIAHNYYKWLE